MSKGPIQLSCTQDQFEGLHEATAKVKRSSTTVKVDKAALDALLMDHSNVLKVVDWR